MRIGIFGGAFNPPHLIHRQIGIDLVKNDYLDKVIFIPVGNLYNKPGLESDINRYNMVKILIKDYPYLEVSDSEFGKLTYTYQTLDYYKEKYPNDEIYFICSSDNLREFDTWREYKYFLTNYKAIVSSRDGDNLEEIVNEKYPEFKNNIILSKLKFKDISSTEIRNRLKESRLSDFSDLLDEEVYKYIIENNLYENVV